MHIDYWRAVGIIDIYEPIKNRNKILSGSSNIGVNKASY